MEMLVERFSGGKDSTLGTLWVDGIFECFTCEDEYREIKVSGETRIPAGKYHIKVQTEGRMAEAYKGRFGSWFRGMLELLNVPQFTGIFIHVGNNSEDTAGCLLVGDSADSYESGGGCVRYSTSAFGRLYQKVIADAEAGRLTIEIVDRD